MEYHGVMLAGSLINELIDEPSKKGTVSKKVKKTDTTNFKTEYNKGLRYYEDQNYKSAYSIIYPLALEDYKHAQALLGVMYDKGNFVSQDMTTAISWYKKAGYQGSKYAQYNLGEIYRNGDGVKKDLVEARRWYEEASNQGDSDAQYTLGVMYFMGDGGNQSYRDAVKWFSFSGKQGNKDAKECHEKSCLFLLREVNYYPYKMPDVCKNI
jgi:TPR repeat protein